MQPNTTAKELWGDGSLPNISDVLDSCLGYARCPGLAFIHRTINDVLVDLNGIKTIELGCGEGKVSLLYALQGARTTIVDYSLKQLSRAKYIADTFNVQPVITEGDILQLPKSFSGQYNISMSFGTAEHFFGKDRQSIFNVHFDVLQKGGLSIVWVPNQYGILFHFGVIARMLLKRQICPVDETSFSRKELSRRAKKAGFMDIKIIGGGLLSNDFTNFIIDFRRLLKLSMNQKPFSNAYEAKKELLQHIKQNNTTLRPWNNLFSYPLILIGRRN